MYSKFSLTGFTPENHGSGLRKFSPGGKLSINFDNETTGNEQNVENERNERNERYEGDEKDAKGRYICSERGSEGGNERGEENDSQAMRQSESMHLACKALLLLVRHRGSHLKVCTSFSRVHVVFHVKLS